METRARPKIRVLSDACVWPDLRWAARCSAHQALMSSRRRDGESRFLAIGTLVRQYTAQSVARDGLSRQTLIYRRFTSINSLWKVRRNHGLIVFSEDQSA